jgi:formylglycine-generating enzyme
MAAVNASCVDRWEAFVVEVDSDGNERPHSPYVPVEGLTVRAKSAAGVIPQGYISQVQAEGACELAGKRLCSDAEFQAACRGPEPDHAYPYAGKSRVDGYCNEGKGSMAGLLFGNDPTRWTYADLNDPRLNQLKGGLAPTGSFPQCESPYGIWDCVGNLHEWGADRPDDKGHARLRGGFYGDSEINGHGCQYVTTAHQPTYHDYSTGLRCCTDARPRGATDDAVRQGSR